MSPLISEAARPPLTLGADLERDRVERRLAKVSVVVDALKQRAGDYRDELGNVPSELGQAIGDFEAQIAVMNARLLALPKG